MPLRRFFLNTRIFGPRVSPSTTAITRALATNGAPARTSPPSFSTTSTWSSVTSAPGSPAVAVEGRKAAGRHLDLTPARLNDCVHNRHLCKGDSLQPKWLRCKGLPAYEPNVSVQPVIPRILKDELALALSRRKARRARDRQESSMRVIAGAFFLATIVLSASARAQQTGPDQSLTRIRTALEAPPPLQQLLAPLPPWVAPGPTRLGFVTFLPPDTRGGDGEGCRPDRRVGHTRLARRLKHRAPPRGTQGARRGSAGPSTASVVAARLTVTRSRRGPSPSSGLTFFCRVSSSSCWRDGSSRGQRLTTALPLVTQAGRFPCADVGPGL